MGLKPKIKRKRWNASEEREIIKFWIENKTFKFVYNLNKPNYIIDTPPPYVSGRAHLGFAIHYAQIDMIARYKRMQGYNVVFPACVDRNGLPVEVKVEQTLGMSMHDIDREDFLQICRIELDKENIERISVMTPPETPKVTVDDVFILGMGGDILKSKTLLEDIKRAESSEKNKE